MSARVSVLLKGRMGDVCEEAGSAVIGRFTSLFIYL